MKRILLLATILMGLSLPFISCTKETTTVKQAGNVTSLAYDGTKLAIDSSSVYTILAASTAVMQFKSEIHSYVQSAWIQAQNGTYNQSDFINNAAPIVTKYDKGYIKGPFSLLENDQVIKTWTLSFADR